MYTARMRTSGRRGRDMIGTALLQILRFQRKKARTCEPLSALPKQSWFVTERALPNQFTASREQHRNRASWKQRRRPCEGHVLFLGMTRCSLCELRHRRKNCGARCRNTKESGAGGEKCTAPNPLAFTVIWITKRSEIHAQGCSQFKKRGRAIMSTSATDYRRRRWYTNEQMPTWGQPEASSTKAHDKSAKADTRDWGGLIIIGVCKLATKVSVQSRVD